MTGRRGKFVKCLESSESPMDVTRETLSRTPLPLHYSAVCERGRDGWRYVSMWTTLEGPPEQHKALGHRPGKLFRLPWEPGHDFAECNLRSAAVLII